MPPVAGDFVIKLRDISVKFPRFIGDEAKTLLVQAITEGRIVWQRILLKCREDRLAFTDAQRIHVLQVCWSQRCRGKSLRAIHIVGKDPLTVGCRRHFARLFDPLTIATSFVVRKEKQTVFLDRPPCRAPKDIAN